MIINKKKTEKLHENNYTGFGLNINLATVLTAVILLIGIGIYAFINRSSIEESVAGLKDAVLVVFSYPLIFTTSLAFVLVIGISLSPLGKIRLGSPNQKPRFKTMSWYAMLFGAGMGIGFMFFGVAEPLMHYGTTPLFPSDNLADSALATTVFHWGLFGWAIYALISLGLAFYAFNHHLPLAPRSLFYPLLKQKIYGITGHIIDGVAVLLTLFSLAASLGFGALQVNAGLNYLLNVPQTTWVQVVLIILVTIAATISLVSGVDKGIRLISEWNMYLAALLALIVLLIGPTIEILSSMFSSTVLFVKDFFMTNINLAFELSDPEISSWAGGWTIFYWAWWVGWAIFVGIFIAKISLGRTVRELLLSVTIIPTIIAVIWFSIFGEAAIFFNLENGGALMDVVNTDEALSLYALIDYMNVNSIFTGFLYILSIILVVSFFVTSSDSGSMVVDNLTSAGALKNPKTQKIFWASMEGVIAIFLIIAGASDTLQMIQDVLIIIAGPLSIVFILLFFLLLYQLIFDHTRQRKKDDTIKLK